MSPKILCHKIAIWVTKYHG